jgi:glycosyltransferase involved in cell wall biosynthesis
MIDLTNTGCRTDIREFPTSLNKSVAFSVILATYNRGQHIVPTIRSVLRQSFQDFELYIIGDCCSDDTAAVVKPFLNERIHWLNLPERGKSQSYPNNAGLKLARGTYAAYIGHDDIWAADHLEKLNKCFAADATIDFAVSGCLMHGPADSGHYRVTGIFDDDSAKLAHFFPPSSLAHKRNAVEQIGYWRDPLEVSAPVDADLLLRAARAGLRFRSTGTITAHKFTAALRYLSYVQPTSHEQEAVLELLLGEDVQEKLDQAIAKAREFGRFMTTRYEDYERLSPGARYRSTMHSRGVDAPPLQPVGRGLTIRQTAAYAGLDWQPPRRWLRMYRMSGMNPRPKILIPAIHSERVEFRIEVVKVTSPDVLKNLVILLNECAVSFRMWKSSDNTLILIFEGMLKSNDYSIVQLDLTRNSASGSAHTGRIGIANIRLQPVEGAIGSQHGQ